MAAWVPNLWAFGVCVGFDPYRHWVYLVEGIQYARTFEGRRVGWRAIDDPNMPPYFGTTMALVANSMSIETNNLDHGPIRCYMSDGLAEGSRILAIQTI